MATKSNSSASMTKSKSTSEKKTVTAKKSGLSHDEIARQAYMLWLERGGNSMDNWIEAERRLH